MEQINIEVVMGSQRSGRHSFPAPQPKVALG